MDVHWSAHWLASAEWESILRLCVAAILGSLIGIERSIAGKQAGMRTYALVTLGSAAYVIVGTLASYELSFFSGINPLQIAGSIVIGIGFIGSGLAAFHGDRPAELTTAAGIWSAAAVGMACGFGLYYLACAGAFLTLIIFGILPRAERAIEARLGASAAPRPRSRKTSQ